MKVNFSMFRREVKKVITEIEYDDIEKNRVTNVDVRNKFKFFGFTVFSKVYNEDLNLVDGGECKSKEKKIGFGKQLIEEEEF